MPSRGREKSSTRGFPSPSLGGFGFIVTTTNYSRELLDRLTVNIIGNVRATGDVRFGSLADYWTDSSLMSASEGKADFHVGQFRKKFGVALGMSAFLQSGRFHVPKITKIKVRFREKQTFRLCQFCQ